jgi:hypothetical protein
VSDSKRVKAMWRRWVAFDRPYINPGWNQPLRAWVQGEMSSGMPDPTVERWADRKGVRAVPF